MPATDTSGSGPSGRLYAEPVRARTLITEAEVVGTQASTDASAHSTSPSPLTASSPLDAAIQAARIAFTQPDTAATTTAAASSVIHAGGSDASVTDVTTTDMNNAGDITSTATQLLPNLI